MISAVFLKLEFPVAATKTFKLEIGKRKEERG